MKISEIDFVSQRITSSGKKRDKYADISCGVACLMMLLKHAKIIKPPSFNQLCNDLNVRIDAHTKNVNKKVLELYCGDEKCYGVFQEDIEAYLIKHNISFKPTKYSKPSKTISIDKLVSIIEKKVPIMVKVGKPLDKKGEGHWIVLYGHEKDTLLYLDPWNKKKYCHKICKNEFCQSWDGITTVPTFNDVSLVTYSITVSY